MLHPEMPAIVRIPRRHTRLEKDPNIKHRFHGDAARALSERELLQETLQRRPVFDRPSLRHRQGVDRQEHLPGKSSRGSEHGDPAHNGLYSSEGFPMTRKRRRSFWLRQASRGLKPKLWSPQGVYPKDFEMAQAIQRMLKKVGLIALSTRWNGRLSGGDSETSGTGGCELFILGWAPSSAEARWVLYPLFTTEQWVPKGNNRFFTRTLNSTRPSINLPRQRPRRRWTSI